MSSSPRQDGLIAALIPAWQEESFIFEVVTRSLPYVGKVLVVNDGSTDRTLEEAQRAGAEVISHPQNRGKGNAIQTGLKHLSAHGCYHVIILDGDLQHLPEEISRFVEEIRKNDPAMVIGARTVDDGKMPFVRKCTNQFMSWLISTVCGQKIADTQCGFRSLRADIIDLIRQECTSTGFDFESEMLMVASRHGYRIASVPVSTVYGTEISKIRPVPDTVRFFKLMLRYLFLKSRPQNALSSSRDKVNLPNTPNSGSDSGG